MADPRAWDHLIPTVEKPAAKGHAAMLPYQNEARKAFEQAADMVAKALVSLPRDERKAAFAAWQARLDYALVRQEGCPPFPRDIHARAMD